MKSQSIATFISGAVLCAGFGAIDPPNSFAQVEIVAIAEIQVNVTDSPSDHNEIEVHIFEQGTDLFIGCSGEQSGLACVNQPNVLYRVAAYFQKPNGEALTFDEIKEKHIYLEVIENDAGACPAAIVSGDDLAGISDAFPASRLETPQVFRFGAVPRLSISKVISGEPFPFPPADIVYITEIRADETDGLSANNEIEVHIYESGTNLFLGCSGDHNGLNYVDQAGLLYRVRACFQKPHSEAALTFDEIKNRTIYLKVIEDDANSCPAQDSIPPDDLVGTSAPFPSSSLNPPRTMQFGDVKHLTIGVVLPSTVNVSEAQRAIHGFQLSQNHPNPLRMSAFVPETTIEYLLPPQPAGKVHVTLRIYDLQGRVVRTLVSKSQLAGGYAITWDGRNEQGQPIASGVYLYQLQAGDFVQTRRLALVR